MTVAQTGDRVTIHYIGTLDNGHIFDRAEEDRPLIFTLGAGEIFASLEAAIIGLQVGAARNVEIPAEQAYGAHRNENMVRVARQQFPSKRELRCGEKISIAFADGEERIMRVIREEGDEVILDGNHPLAGFDLTFALQLVAIDCEDGSACS